VVRGRVHRDGTPGQTAETLGPTVVRPQHGG
jgi:hypothetical protein